jgi:cytochrome c peroxidase
MHAGQITSLDDVLAHYAAAPAAPFGRSELVPIRLSPNERRQLIAFLGTLSGPITVPPTYDRTGALAHPAAR